MIATESYLAVILVCWAVAIGVFIFSFLAHRKGVFGEGYSILWLSFSFSLALLPLISGPLFNLLSYLGFKTLTSFLFFMGIFACFVFLMILSIHVSKLRKEIRKIAQDFAIRGPSLPNRSK